MSRQRLLSAGIGKTQWGSFARCRDALRSTGAPRTATILVALQSPPRGNCADGGHSDSDSGASAAHQKSAFASCRKSVRFVVILSRFFDSRLHCTSAISFWKALASFACLSGVPAC